MPEPLAGLVVVAELGSKFEADAVVARLVDAGIDATPSYDPAANSVAPFAASDRVFEVLVREGDAGEALAILAAGPGALPPEFTEQWAPAGEVAGPPTRRRRLVPWAVVLLAVLALPAVLAVIAMLAALAR